MKERILIVHDTRSLGVAAAAQTKVELEQEGYEVDTKASYLETGFAANFWNRTLDTLHFDTYQRIIILNIPLGHDSEAFAKLQALEQSLRDQGKTLEYIDTHQISPVIQKELSSMRRDIVRCLQFRPFAKQAARSGQSSRRMVIGAIADRDRDPEIVKHIDPEDEKLALGLDIAVRGDFQMLLDLVTRERVENLESVVQTFFCDFWNDQELAPQVKEKIPGFVQKVLEYRRKYKGKALGEHVQILIFQTFSEDLIHRTVEELALENYPWLARMAEKMPSFEVISKALILGDVTIVPITDQLSSWVYKMLDAAVREAETPFGMAILCDSEDRRQGEDPLDRITIVKRWPLQGNTVQEIIEANMPDVVRRIKPRGMANGLVFRFPANSPESLDFFCTLLRLFGGEEVRSKFQAWWPEVIRFYAKLLAKASHGVERVSMEYLGKEAEIDAKRFSDRLIRKAVGVMKNLFQSDSLSNKTEEDVQRILRQCDQDIEIACALVRLLPRKDLEKFDVDSLQGISIEETSAPTLRNNKELLGKMLEIIQKQFSEKDKEIFVKTVMTDPKQKIILCRFHDEIISFYADLEKNRVHHLDWFVINPKFQMGLGEATIMREFSREGYEQRQYEAAVSPAAKTTVLALERTGFIAYAETSCDPYYPHGVYLRVRKSSENTKYRGKALTPEEVQQLMSRCTTFRTPYQEGSLTVIKVEMPKDNDLVLDAMKEHQGKEVMSRFIPDPKIPHQFYVLFEPLIKASTAADEGQSDPSR